MTNPEVEYDLHDSSIVSVSSGPRREVSVAIDLYPIFYPDKQRIQLRFGGIENFDTVRRYVDAIRQKADDRDYIGCRIDAFHYDTKRESKAGGYWFYFKTDWGGPVRIHCAKMSITELHSRSCEQSHAPEPATGPESNGESSPPAR